MATGRLPDPNTAPVTAKGDLYTYSTVPAKLAVGSNGETLVADSSASTGLRWQGAYAAGKNKIINGDFNIWQRGTSFSTMTVGQYTADRWFYNPSGGTATITRSAFTPGTAPVAGYEGNYFLNLNATVANDFIGIVQRIEDVTTFAGQTATVSFWAKATSAITLRVYFTQNFGSGGSASVDTQAPSDFTLSTSWARYSVTISVPSISGKTIGTSSFLALSIFNPNNQTFNMDIWGVQAEAGNVATAFQTATGTLAGELSACLRYFQVLGGTSANEGLAVGFNYSTTAAACVLPFRQQMRSAPTISFGTGAAASDFALYNASGTPLTVTSFTILDAALGSTRILASVASGLVQGNGTNLITNSTTGKLFVSAEL